MAQVPVTSSGATSATEMELILSIVQDELLRNTKLRGTVMDLSSQAVKGVKIVDVPKFTTSFTGPQDVNLDGLTNADFESPVFGVDSIALNKWKVLPYRIPDKVSTQTRINLEAELAKSAGEHMGIFIEDQIVLRLRTPSTSAPDHDRALDGAALGGAGPTEITLEGISTAKQLLDRQNVPETDRFLAVPPEQLKAIIDLDNFRNADKFGSREALLKGEVGEIYGLRVIMTNALSANEAIAYHRSAVAIAIQQEIKFEVQRADLRIQATDYSFSMCMGDQVMDGGVKQVYLHSA